jgi:hypothetical protein
LVVLNLTLNVSGAVSVAFAGLLSISMTGFISFVPACAVAVVAAGAPPFCAVSWTFGAQETIKTAADTNAK